MPAVICKYALEIGNVITYAGAIASIAISAGRNVAIEYSTSLALQVGRINTYHPGKNVAIENPRSDHARPKVP